MSEFLQIQLNDRVAALKDFNPVSNKNGVATWMFRPLSANADTFVKLTSNVRSGALYNPSSGKQRVKRRVSVRLAVPYVTGFSFDDGTPKVDTIDIDVDISIPLDAPSMMGEDATSFIIDFMKSDAFIAASLYGESVY